MKKFKVHKNIKYLASGLTLFLLFHFETVNIASVKLSHLWKGILLIFLILKIITNNQTSIHLYKPLIWLSILQLVNIELFNNPFNAVFLSLTTLLLPLIGLYLMRFSVIELQKAMLFFSSFFILSFIPYEIGILKSLGNQYQLTSYGVEQTGIIGPFQGAHAASTALAGSFLTLLYFWFKKYTTRLYLTVLLILCFYFLIFTYVRTGMLMVIIGAIPILIYFAKKEASTRFQLILFGGIFSILISGWILSNEVLMNRITGNRINKSETESFKEFGSGRGLIYIYSVDIFLEADVFEKIIGIGQTEQVKRMKTKLGSGLIPHNGFLLLLLNTGVLGLIVFLVFIKKVIKLYRNTRSSNRVLLKALFFAYFVMTFFQNYDLMYVYLFLALGISLSLKLTFERKQTNN